MPLFESDSKCETILMKMTLICMKIKQACRTHFHISFRFWTRFEREAQENSEMAYLSVTFLGSVKRGIGRVIFTKSKRKTTHGVTRLEGSQTIF